MQPPDQTRDSHASPPPSSQRPLPLVARNDLKAQPIQYQNEQYWVVKDPIKLAYFRLQPQQHAILQLLDGQRSPEQIHAEFSKQFPAAPSTLAEIHHLIFDLYEKGLVWSRQSGQADALTRREANQRRKRWRQAWGNLLFIRFPGWDPARLIEYLYPATRWIFHPLALLLAAILLVAALAIPALNVDAFQRRMPDAAELLSWRSLLVIWITMGAAKILHELAHGLACRRFGGECHEIGLALLVFSPCLYCDVSDSWMFPSKWKRMAVAAAGMYVELTISAIALLLWWNTAPGWTSQWLFSVFIVTSVSVVVFNLNPLLRLDGYYLLSDWLEIPNLRRKSHQVLARMAARVCLGVQPPVDPLLPKRGEIWFGLFAICAAIYKWLLLGVISFVLYRTLQPYQLQNLGLLLGGSVAAVAIFSALRRFRRFLKDHGDEMQRSRRPRTTLILAAVSICVLLFAPLPIQIQAPFVVAPRNVHHVFAAAPGHLHRVHVRPGQVVREGQLLAELIDWKLIHRRRRLETARAVQEIQLRVDRATGDATQAELTWEGLEAIQKELEAVDGEIDQLRIIAPCSGRVIAAPKTKVESPNAGSGKLASWSGNPLEAKNRDCYLSVGTHVLSIAPDKRCEAVVLIDAYHHSDFRAGRQARLKFEHLPDAVIRSAVARVAVSTVALRSRIGEIKSPGTSDIEAMGKTELAPQTTVAYQAVIPIPHRRDDALLAGARGRAKVLVANRSAASMLLRYVRNTFYFAL